MLDAGTRNRAGAAPWDRRAPARHRVASRSGVEPASSPVIRTGTRSRAADGAWNMSPFMPGDGFFPPLLSPAAGVAAKRPGVDLNPAILGKGCRFVHPHSGLGRWGCPESRVHRLRGCPPVRTGTRSRAGDGAWTMSPFSVAVVWSMKIAGPRAAAPAPDHPFDRGFSRCISSILNRIRDFRQRKEIGKHDTDHRCTGAGNT